MEIIVVLDSCLNTIVGGTRLSGHCTPRRISDLAVRIRGKNKTPQQAVHDERMLAPNDEFSILGLLAARKSALSLKID